MYKKMIEQVKEFYIAFKQEEFLKEYGITPERMNKRLDWFKEETEELIEAIEKKDKVKIADAIIDMMYIRIGTLLEHHRGKFIVYDLIANDLEINICKNYFHDYFGIDYAILFDAFDEVHRSNMSKLDENGEPIFREDGKIIKSHLFIQPDLTGVLLKYDEL